MKKSMGGGQEVKKGGGCRCAREGRTPSTAGRTKNMERNADCRIRPECNCWAEYQVAFFFWDFSQSSENLRNLRFDTNILSHKKYKS